MILSLLGGLIPGFIKDAVGMVGDHFKHKRELKSAQVNATVRIREAQTQHIITSAERGQLAEIDWNHQALKNAGESWKDEYILILFSPPLIMAFIPGLAPYVGLGFAQLDLMPEWYKMSIGVMVAGSYGHQKLIKYFGNRK